MLEPAESKVKKRRTLKKLSKVRITGLGGGPGIFAVLCEDVEHQESV